MITRFLVIICITSRSILSDRDCTKRRVPYISHGGHDRRVSSTGRQ